MHSIKMTILICILLYPFLLKSVVSDCINHQPVKYLSRTTKKFSVSKADSQAVEVSLKIKKECTKGGDTISATLSDVERKMTFAHFSSLCGMSWKGYVCRNEVDTRWNYYPGVWSNKCHIRTVLAQTVQYSVWVPVGNLFVFSYSCGFLTF